MSVNAMDTRQEAMRRAGEDETVKRLMRAGVAVVINGKPLQRARTAFKIAAQRMADAMRGAISLGGNAGQIAVPASALPPPVGLSGTMDCQMRCSDVPVPETAVSRGDAEGAENGDGGADHEGHEGHEERAEAGKTGDGWATALDRATALLTRIKGQVERAHRHGRAAAVTWECPVCGLRVRGQVRLLDGRTMHVHGERVREDGDAIIFGCVEVVA